MKQIILFFLIFVFSHTWAQEILTNQKVYNMVKVGLSESVIVDKILMSECDFNVSTDTLLKMVNLNISQRIIAQMVEVEKQKTLLVKDTFVKVTITIAGSVNLMEGNIKITINGVTTYASHTLEQGTWRADYYLRRGDTYSLLLTDMSSSWGTYKPQNISFKANIIEAGKVVKTAEAMGMNSKILIEGKVLAECSCL